MKRTRKIITAVIVFLLLGAIVNVAVAWGIAARKPCTKGFLFERVNILDAKHIVESKFDELDASRRNVHTDAALQHVLHPGGVGGFGNFYGP